MEIFGLQDAVGFALRKDVAYEFVEKMQEMLHINAVHYYAGQQCTVLYTCITM